MAQKAIRTTLPDGRTALNNIIDKFTGESIQLVKIPSLPNGATSDGVIYFQTSDSTWGTEYWERAFADSLVNVKWFGAKGDGINDDYSALQTAIDSVNNKTIVIPAGIYNIETKLTIPTNKQVVIQGEGMNRVGASTVTDGVVVIRYLGQSDEEAVEIKGDLTNRARVIFSNINIINASGRTDVDGIKCNYLTATKFDTVSISGGFRDNLSINGYFFYNLIYNCSFRGANRHGVYCSNGVLMNGTEFQGCRFGSNGGWGFYSEGGLGEVLTIRGCYIEANSFGGLTVKRALVANIENNYFEFNDGINIDIFNRPSVPGSGVANVIANITGNKFRCRDNCHVISATAYDEINTVTLNINGNTIENYDISSDNTTTYLVHAITGSNRVIINMSSNTSAPSESAGRVVFSNRKTFDFFYRVNIGPDQFMASLPDTPDRMQTTINMNRGINAIRSEYTLPDGGATNFDITFPGKSTTDAVLRIANGVATSGNVRTDFYRSNSVVARVDHSEGRMEASTAFTTTAPSKRGVYIGGGNPEGVVTAPPNSLFLSDAGIFIKATGTSNTGWELWS